MQENKFFNPMKKDLLMRFISLFLACFILTLTVFLAIAFVINSGGDYRPLPPFYLVVAISFFIAVFLFIPWGSFFFSAKEKIPEKITVAFDEVLPKALKANLMKNSGEVAQKDLPKNDYVIEYEDKNGGAKAAGKNDCDDDKKPAKADGENVFAKAGSDKENPDFEKAMRTAQEFALKTIGAVKAKDVNMDIYTRIAINLIVAGGCERMGSFFSLGDEEYKKILELSVREVADNTFVPDAQRDKHFYKILNGPLLEPYHRNLIALGTRAMDVILRGVKADAFEGLGDTLDEWREKTVKELLPLEGIQKQKTTLTMMFTDIVDSTMMSEINGEQFAQDILHVHNAVARQAIKDFKGREIKLMGDGVFACFNTAAEGAKAAMQMQRAFSKFNRENPNRMFYVRIGLNLGKPIVENGDLFGMAVGRASRVCHKAGGGTIFVTRDMYDDLIEAGIELKDEGEFDFKGIVEKERVYSIVWR